jgi:hypothetical protein
MLKSVKLKCGTEAFIDLRSVDVAEQADENIVKILMSSGRAFELIGQVKDIVDLINAEKCPPVNNELEDLKSDILEAVGNVELIIEHCLERILESQNQPKQGGIMSIVKKIKWFNCNK